MTLAIAIIVFFGIIGVGVFVLLVIQQRKKHLTEGEMAFVRNQWRMIGMGRNPKNDILEADKLLDYVLTKYGYQGSLGEKLKAARSLFSDIDGVWVAHKLRNQIAHEMNFTPPQSEVDLALKSFKKALQDLKIKL